MSRPPSATARSAAALCMQSSRETTTCGLKDGFIASRVQSLSLGRTNCEGLLVLMKTLHNIT